jgi:peptidyl-prolyl cis-trans isomerase C
MSALEVMNTPAKPPEFTYHLLRGAVERFSKALPDLDEQQYQQAMQQADKTYALESLVLSTDEARDVVVAENKIDEAVDEVAKRYSSREEFLQDMEKNGLDEDTLRNALQRELMFDAVMERVAARSPAISDLDVRIFYELHKDRFELPEKRSTRHILVTINPDYPENTPEQARQRLQEYADQARRKPKRFAALAREHSECPSALQDGLLGDVKRGDLYPELDAALFKLAEGEVSELIETEVGLHILLCEKIHRGRTLPFAKVEPRVREALEQRRRRVCQKAWLDPLRGNTDDN